MDQMGKGSGVLPLAAIAVAMLVGGCGGGNGDNGEPSGQPPGVDQAGVRAGGPDVGVSFGSAKGSGSEALFRPCHSGPGGGGYRIRAVAISCDEVRRILGRMFSSATLVTRRERERVYRNDDGWTCLSQGQPRRFGFTLVLCVRGSQAILYRFS